VWDRTKEITLRELPASEALEYLIQRRAAAVANAWSKMNESGNLLQEAPYFQQEWVQSPMRALRRLVRRDYTPRPSPLLENMLKPVHPILLVSALVMYRMSPSESARQTLHSYICGAEVDDLYNYIAYHDALSPDGAVASLTAELDLYPSLEASGYAKAASRTPRMIWPKDWRNREQASIWDVRLAAWFHCNPISVGYPDVFWASALREGIDRDGLIHNTREGIQVKLDITSRDLNVALSQKADETTMRTLALEHKRLSLQLQRIITVYRWAAHEIEAHAVGLQVAREVARYHPESRARYAQELISAQQEQEIVSVRNG
jgi:hypothetical protein